MVAQSLLMLNLGMIISVPTIVIGALHNTKEDLSLDDEQSSWIGKIIVLRLIKYICIIFLKFFFIFNINFNISKVKICTS